MARSPKQFNSRSAQFNVRIPHDLDRRLTAEANARFEGNRGQATREAIRIYLTLRETMGSQFEPMLETFARRASQSS